MSEFPSLAKALGKHTQICGGFLWSCECGVDWDENRDITHAEHQADAWREACAIRTVEQLDALPVDILVRDALGEGWIRDLRGNHSLPWYRTGDDQWHTAAAIPLPALLIWHPDWARP